MDSRVTPPKRVTSPTWGPLPPCKQALKVDTDTLTDHKDIADSFNRYFASVFTSENLTHLPKLLPLKLESYCGN